jgi:electron transport complex protein RnfG
MRIMKKIFKMMSSLAVVAAAAMLVSAAPKQDNDVMTKEDGMYVVNTTTLGKNVTGYVSTTPVKIYIKKDKIVKVEALKNEETPKYMAKVKKGLMNKWDGMKVKDAMNLKVDAVTGATFTSDAISQNVQLGLEYYKKNK